MIVSFVNSVLKLMHKHVLTEGERVPLLVKTKKVLVSTNDPSVAATLNLTV